MGQLAVWVLTIRGVLRTLFSNDPQREAERKKLENWYKNDIKGKFREGYNNPRPKGERYQVFTNGDRIRIIVVFLVVLGIAVWLASRPL